MTTHSSILAWRIPWTEEPGELKSMGSQRVRHDCVTNTHTYVYLVLAALSCPVPWTVALQTVALSMLSICHFKNLNIYFYLIYLKREAKHIFPRTEELQSQRFLKLEGN